MRFGLVFLVLGTWLCPLVAAQPGGHVVSTDLTGCAWHSSPGAHLTVHGGDMELRVSSLPQPEPRTIECWVPLPGNQEMVVSGKHRGAVTEVGWTFAFERMNGGRRELHRGTQEGTFAFPVPPSWQNDPRIGVLIGIPGDNPGYLRLQDVHLEAASHGLPAAPQPLSPEDGQEVTPAAADFLWLSPPPALVSGYDLEWQRRAEKPERMHVAAYFISDAQGAWPRRWLTPGSYSWRVRALNPGGAPGPWSKTMQFAVRAEKANQTPDIIPSPKRPVFLIDLETSDPGSVWMRVPADVRTRLIIRIGGSPDQIDHTLAVAQRIGIPIALQVNGPHDIIAGRWDRVPLARLARWVRQYPVLKAFYICEQEVQGGIKNPEVKTYLERLIALGAEEGRPVCWADANWGRNIWLDVEASQDFTRFLRAHRGYFYPLWKMNGGFEPYLAPAGLIGLWLSDNVAAWGVQPESWYWTEAGFGTLGVQHDYKEGERTDAPPVVFQELALLGASAGAEIYSFEPGTDLVGTDSGRNLETILIPLIRMLTDSVIPDVHEVQAAVVKEHVLEPADLVFRKDYTASMRQFFSNTLGMTYPFEMVPESGRCYWIPFVPKGVTAAPAFGNQTDAASPPSKTCGPPVRSDAAVFGVGKTAFVFDSRLNWPEEERFSLSLAGTHVNGKLGVNGWVVAWGEDGNEAHVWFFARRDAGLVMDFDTPVLWKRVQDNDNDPSSAPTTKNEAEQPAAWSGPVSHIELRAETRPWDILIRRSGAE